MSDETLLETLKKASSAIYIVTDEETANHISILFRRAGSEIATLQSDLAAARTQIALYLDDYEQLCALMHRRDKDLAAAREELERAREALIDIWARHPNFPLNGKTPREQAEAHYAREVAHAPKGEEG